MSAHTTLERPAARIDPRIRARRIAVRRHEGRRRLQRFLDAGLVLAVAAAFLGALRSPLLDVDEVAVVGAARTGADAVRAAAGIAPGDQLMDLDLRAAGARVAALPWVDEVRVERGVDGRVSLAVAERRPAALLELAGGALVVDGEGRALAPAAEAPPTEPLVAITGASVSLEPGEHLPAALADVVAVADRLGRAAPGAVSSLAVGPGLEGTLTAGGVVRFGDATGIDAKIRSLTTVLAQVDLTCLAVVDVRLPGSPVLTRDEACS